MSLTVRQATGFSLLLLAGLLIVGVPLSIGLLDHNPRDRHEIADFLNYIYEHQTLYAIRMATVIFKDAVVGVVVAAGLYLSFEHQNRHLAFIGSMGLLVSTAAFLVVDAMEAAMIPLAQDYAEGGAGGSGAGEATTLEIARVLAIVSGMTAQASFASFGVGLAALGVLFVREKEKSLPPSWLGWLSLVVACCWWLLWLSVLIEAAFVFIPLGALSGIIWMIGLGLWLLRTPDPPAV